MTKVNACSVCGQPASHVIIKEESDLIGAWRLLCDLHFSTEAPKPHFAGFTISEHTCTASMTDIKRKGLYGPFVCQTEG
jgi:hypothetical protein